MAGLSIFDNFVIVYLHSCRKIRFASKSTVLRCFQSYIYVLRSTTTIQNLVTTSEHLYNCKVHRAYVVLQIIKLEELHL